MSTSDEPPEEVEQCVECGSVDGLVRHHTDYETDTTVTVCRACHQKIHADKSHRLYPNDEPPHTSMAMSEKLADELFDRKRRGESYEDVIWRLIDEADESGVGGE